MREAQESEWLRLSLTGELDMATAPDLERRLRELQSEGRPVLMDLSELAFIDTTGLGVMFRVVASAHRSGWTFRVDTNVAPQAQSAFKLVALDQFIEAMDSNAT